MTYAVRVAITMNIYNFYFFSLRVFYCYVWSCTHLSSFILFGISYIIPDLMSSSLLLDACSLISCCPVQVNWVVSIISFRVSDATCTIAVYISQLQHLIPDPLRYLEYIRRWFTMDQGSVLGSVGYDCQFNSSTFLAQSWSQIQLFQLGFWIDY